METLVTRICRAAAMGVAWAAAWMPIGLVIARLFLDPHDTLDEPWIALGTLPGFFCGVLYAELAGIASSRRRLDELPVIRAAAWGAATGLLISALAHLAGVRIPQVDPDGIKRPVLVDPVAIIVTVTLLSALSGIASALIARRYSHPSDEALLLKRQ